MQPRHTPRARGETNGGTPRSTAASLAERVFEVLLHRVKEGGFPEGTWLREPDLVAELGVSRTPVRQALERLCASGYAERVPRQGVRAVPAPRGHGRTGPVELDVRTLAEQIYERLLDLVFSSGMQGQRLTVVELAQRLGVSRTPVRRALDRLEADGLVVSRPRGGVLFTTIDIERIRNVYEVRAELEGLAAQLCAKRMKKSTVEELLKENRRLLRSPRPTDQSRLLAQELRIHTAIIDACEQPFLKKTLDGIYGLVHAFQAAGYHAPLMAQRAILEHGMILDAIQRRQGIIARNRMILHVHSTCNHIVAAAQGRDASYV